MILFSEKNKSFYSSVFVLVLPMALQNLINSAVTAADVFMLGRLNDTVLSGASLAGQIQYIMTLIFFGLTSGSSVLAAQYWGKKQPEVIEKILGIALKFSVVTAVIFTAVSQLFPEWCVSLFTSDPAVVEQGAKYLRVLSISFIFTSVTMIYLNIMRSVERVVISTVVYSISLVSNIILNYIFIFGKFGFPELGIVGAAVSTCISRVIELIIVLVYSTGKNNPVHFSLSDIFRHEKELFGDFLKYSLPVTMNELAWGAGVAMNSSVIGHLGESAAAANSIAQVTRQLSMVIALGCANAAAIMLGKMIGSGEMKKAEEYGRKFAFLSVAVGILAAGVILIFSKPLLHFVNLTDAAKDYLGMMLIVMSYFSAAQSVNTTMVVGIFRAGGDTLFGLIMDISTMWGGSILFGSLAAYVFKCSVPVVYVILMSDEVIKLSLSFLRYRSKKWLKNVTRQ